MNQREAGVAAEVDARMLRFDISYRAMQIKEERFMERSAQRKREVRQTGRAITSLKKTGDCTQKQKIEHMLREQARGRQ